MKEVFKIYIVFLQTQFKNLVVQITSGNHISF